MKGGEERGGEERREEGRGEGGRGGVRTGWGWEAEMRQG